MAKPRLYITPRYIAPLKYFEKLVPRLSGHFEISFLLLEDKGMRAYLKERDLPVVETLLETEGRRIPFFSHIRGHQRLLANAEALFEDAPPAVLLTEPSISQPMRAVFALAQKRGIPVRALQWCQQSKAYKDVRLSLKNRVRQIRGRHGSLVFGIPREAYFSLLALMFRLLTSFGVLRAHYEDRHVGELGVIDSFGGEYYVSEGWKREQIKTVGFYDWSIIADLKRRVKDDASFRSSLETRYALRAGRKRVLVLSTIFYAGHATLCMTRKEQVEYFARICADIRDAFADADILFKLHPRDEEIYEPLERMGVRLLRTEANVEELIALSDLYVAHPLTAANFAVIASGTPALFVNFTPLSHLNLGAELYGLSRIITDREEFRAGLREAAAGRLPLFYDASRADPSSLPKIIAFVRGVDFR